jgi:sugar phosphate isomerase/epimerase
MAYPPCGPVVAGSTLPLPPVTIACGDTAWSRGLSALTRGGFDWVDVVDTWLPFGDLTVRQADALAGAVTASGLRLAGMSAIRRSVIDPVDGMVNLAYTHRALDVAAAAGAPVLSIGFHRPLTTLQQQWSFWSVPGSGDDLGDPEVWGLAVERLSELVKHAADVGVALSLELYEDTLLGSGAMAARLVEEIGSPALGINADLANLYRVPRRLTEGWLEAFAVCLPHLNYWHVKNYRRAEGYPDGPFLAWPTQLADGDINYRALLAMAVDAGYTGPISIEQYGGDGLTAQCAGLRYLTDLLAEIRREAS